MEYIWSLEEELEDDDDDWNGGNPEHPDAECDYYTRTCTTSSAPSRRRTSGSRTRSSAARCIFGEENKLMVQLGQGLKPPLESSWKICIFGRELIGRERSTSWIGL